MILAQLKDYIKLMESVNPFETTQRVLLPLLNKVKEEIT